MDIQDTLHTLTKVVRDIQIGGDTTVDAQTKAWHQAMNALNETHHAKISALKRKTKEEQQGILQSFFVEKNRDQVGQWMGNIVSQWFQHSLAIASNYNKTTRDFLGTTSVPHEIRRTIHTLAGGEIRQDTRQHFTLMARIVELSPTNEEQKKLLEIIQRTLSKVPTEEEFLDLIDAWLEKAFQKV